MFHIDYLTVIVASIVYMIILSLWYSKYLFGNIWLELREKEPRKKILGYVFNFFAALILAYFLSLVEVYLGATSFWDGVIVGFVVYFGFVFTTQIVSVIWFKNSFKLFLIDNVFYMISLMIMGGILVG